MSEKNCPKVYIATVDNSAEDCGECGFTSFDCLTFPNAIESTGIAEGDSGTEVIEKIIERFAKLDAPAFTSFYQEEATEVTTIATQDVYVKLNSSTVEGLNRGNLVHTNNRITSGMSTTN